MDHENVQILKKAINELPTHVAPERVWAGIQSEIVPEQNRGAFEKALRDYKEPVKSPVSWEKLALRTAEAGSSRKKIFSLSNTGYWLSGVAAALVIGVCVGVYLSTKNGTKYETQDMAMSPEASEEEAMRFIERFCKGGNVICTSTAFLELKAELDESTEELKEISKQLSVFQNDPTLLQAKSTIEKYRATVLKEITLMI
ncbi:hypothetical protein KK083_14695 [Fulvivirgaceae bacterium PWU4]|uniref:Uncharacterized protein n=1 Tax=Chryseosolibacter histidini TaxID=2782349 RepID=A0AAP2GJL2_9BACT|nr:hypothetical protein [Chryseosolibacter histidini]MBT1698139.1 hypothetical protein [Chryseosolibacter histidini]